MDPTIQRLLDERANLWEQMKTLLEETREAGMSGEQRGSYDALETKVDDLTDEIEKREHAVEIERELDRARRDLAAVDGAPEKGSIVSDVEEDEAKYQRAFLTYLRRGISDASAEERALLVEHRAQNVTVDQLGGFLVPQTLSTQFEIARKAYSGVRNTRAFVFQTTDGGVLSIPTSDDTDNEGEIIAESATVTEQDVTISEVTLDSFAYTSKMVRVTWQLLQDSAFPVMSFLADRFGERIGRIENRHLTVGDGVNKPRGFLTAATLGVTAASTSTILADEVIDLFHSVDPAYRASGEWSLADGTLAALRKLKGVDEQYLWQPGLQAGVPSEILGRPYAINTNMPALGTGERVMAFGDMSKYWIREVRGLNVVRLSERYAERLQTGVFAWMRLDGDLIDAGQHPIKYLQMA